MHEVNERPTEGLRKDFPDGIEHLEEAFLKNISEKDLYILKTDFPNEWNLLT